MRADGSIIINTKGDATGFNNLTKRINGGIAGITASLKQVAVAMGLVFGVAAIINFGKKSVQATNELKNAMIGLKSIMDGQGKSFAEAKTFINDYIDDGLIPATQAINAYKNLAMRGYDASQIEITLTALKDAASFGRQASYSLGEAVQTATEGLKNENSILVDNAGVTKNVSKMWEDYAKSIGVSVKNLTKQQKIQAEVAGIMEETRFQTGDAAKVAANYSGQVLALGFNFNNLKIAIGNAIMPIAWRVLPALNSIITALTRVANLAAQVTTLLFGKKQAIVAEAAAKNVSAAAEAENELADATTKAGKAAKGALAGFDELNVLAKDTAEGAVSAADGLNVDTGNISISEEIGSDVEVSPAIERAVNKIRELLQPLQDIVFDNLKWAWENIFVPLKKWVAEKISPLFLNILIETIKIITTVLKIFQPLGIWLWEKFLKPLAKWTGGVIISVLENLIDILKVIGDWIGNHKILVQDFILIIASFAVAWKLVNIAIFVWNSIGAIAAAVTMAFGAAMAFLTSPVTLVILAIGALIAIIILLIKHWDDVKAISENVWKKIKAIWAVAASWFNTNVTIPVKSFFMDMFAAIGDFGKKAWEGLKSTFKGVADWFLDVVIDPIGKFFKEMINMVIDGMNFLIKGLNKINFSVPSWVPGIGGNSWGINIPSIPKLATGAVIPPNAEFLAILGDQKQGRNIEAPEDLIRQIIREELDSMPSPEVTVVANGNASEIIRYFKFEIDKETRRRGTNLVKGVT